MNAANISAASSIQINVAFIGSLPAFKGHLIKV